MSLALRNHSFNLSLLLLPPHKRGKRSTSTQAMVFGIGSAITFASYYFSLLSDLSEAGIRNGGRGEAKKCRCNTHAMRYGSVVRSLPPSLTNGRGRGEGGPPPPQVILANDCMLILRESRLGASVRNCNGGMSWNVKMDFAASDPSVMLSLFLVSDRVQISAPIFLRWRRPAMERPFKASSCN